MENEAVIAALPKDKWKGTPIPLTTRSDSYYDFKIDPFDKDGCTISIVRKPAEKEIIHTPEEYDFPDSLYQDHYVISPNKWLRHSFKNRKDSGFSLGFEIPQKRNHGGWGR